MTGGFIGSHFVTVFLNNHTTFVLSITQDCAGVESVAGRISFVTTTEQPAADKASTIKNGVFIRRD